MDKQKRIRDTLNKLYNKGGSNKKNVRFSLTELNFIKKHHRRSDYNCMYVIYKKESKHPIGFVIDSIVNSPRRSGVMNNWDVICTRPISDLEWEEVCQNFGCNNRRFQVWWYNSIESLKYEDSLYSIKTPEVFIEECLKRGFNNGYQIKLF